MGKKKEKQKTIKFSLLCEKKGKGKINFIWEGFPDSRVLNLLCTKSEDDIKDFLFVTDVFGQIFEYARKGYEVRGCIHSINRVK